MAEFPTVNGAMLMDSSREDIGQTPLDEYVTVVANIYSTHDGKRSIWDIWCHTLHHAAGIAEQIRRRGPTEKLHTEIADFSLWLFTAILKLTGKFGQSEGRTETAQESLIRIQSSCSDLIWRKYPKLCPKCFAGETVSPEGWGLVNLCECAAQRTEKENDEVRRKRIMAVQRYSDGVRDTKPSSVDQWQEMFGGIFAKNLATLSLSDIALHLMEELGETSDAMVRMYTYKEKTFRLGEPNWRMTNLEGQLADVFSWLFVLTEKLNVLHGEGHQHDKQQLSTIPKRTDSNRLSSIIWQRYGSNDLGSFYCPFCKDITCHCQIILVPQTHPIEELVQKFE
jgi:NTP pyrophosphatase (non-canonical NTP hydrolase)